MHRQGGVEVRLGELALPPGDGPVTLAVRARGQDYALLARAGEGEPEAVAVVDGRSLDSVSTGGFLGLWIGVYATSNGRPTSTTVRVEQFEYLPVS